MFFGEYQHNIDAKGRMIMPSKFRDALGQRFIITKGLEKSLFVFPSEEWRLLDEKVKQLPMADKGIRRFVRFFFGGAMEAEPDLQGRVILPQNLREHADAKKELISVGVSNRIEIWSRENWSKYNENWHGYEEAPGGIDDELAEKMALLGI